MSSEQWIELDKTRQALLKKISRLDTKVEELHDQISFQENLLDKVIKEMKNLRGTT